jgi:hypothetical protein
MAVITFVESLEKVEMTWGMKRLDAESRSVFGVQAIEAGYPLWEVTLSSPMAPEVMSGGWKALLMQLRGRLNQIAMWDMARPIPIGTMRGTMVLGVAAVQGDVSMTIATDASQASKTLVQGDMLGIGIGLTQQVVMVVADATADVSGNIVVTFEPPLRNSFSLSSAVTWDKPKALFRRNDSQTSWKYTGHMAEGFNLNLTEDWRP